MTIASPLRKLACALVAAAGFSGSLSHASTVDCSLENNGAATNVYILSTTEFSPDTVTASARQRGMTSPDRTSAYSVELCDREASSLTVKRSGNLAMSASADLARGQLRAFASDGSHASAGFGERLHFVAGDPQARSTPQLATLRASFDGMASKSASDGWAVGLLSAAIGTDAGSEPMYSPSLELGLFPGQGGATGVEVTGFEYSFEIDFDTNYWFYAELRAVVMDAIGVADYSHTVNFDLDLPEGVSFTSASGYFLSDKLAQHVPEPGALLLACTALALMNARRRRA
jgi:hypothetical protein